MHSVAVIPAYNEGKVIGQLVREVKRYVDFVIVVDDASSDDTAKHVENVITEDTRVILLQHTVNQGKGAAMKTGCEEAKQLSVDVAVFLDGDGQHPPKYIPEILRYMQERSLDVVFSKRQGGDVMPLKRKIGNTLISFCARFLFGLRLSDIWCGFRAYRMSCLSTLSWDRPDYSGEIQMALQVPSKGFSYGEFTIPTVYFDTKRGVKIKDGLKLLCQMVWWKMKGILCNGFGRTKIRS